MYTHGPATYRCSVDLEPNTLVRIKPGSSGLVPLIEPAQYTMPIIGLTKLGGHTGDIISVIPLNTDGYLRVRYTAFNGVAIGDPVYVTSTGTVTDVETSGIEAGRSLEIITDLNSTSIMLDISGAGGFNRASDISVTDAGDYYSAGDKNIESCLDEVGASFSVSHRTFYTGSRMKYGNLDIASNHLGGRLSSDTSADFYMGTYGTGDSTILTTTDTNASAAIPTNRRISRPSLSTVDSSNPIDISFLYNWNVALDQEVDIQNIIASFPDGSSNLNLGSWTMYGTLGEIYEEFVIYSTDTRFETNPFFNIQFWIDLDVAHTITEVNILGLVAYYSKALPI